MEILNIRFKRQVIFHLFYSIMIKKKKRKLLRKNSRNWRRCSCLKFEGTTKEKKFLQSWINSRLHIGTMQKVVCFEIGQQTPVSDLSANNNWWKQKQKIWPEIVSWNKRGCISRIFNWFFHLGSKRQSGNYCASPCCWLLL